MRTLYFLALLSALYVAHASLPKFFKPFAGIVAAATGKRPFSSNLTPQQKSDIIGNASFAYPNATYGIQRAPPKSSLYHVKIPNLKDQSRTAAAWILDIVEFVHYAPFVPGFLGAWSVFKNLDKWATALAGLPHVQVRVLFLLLSPVVAVLGGLPGFTMHDYEGWQVTPFKNPLLEKVDNYVNNNAWLREVAYKYIFVIQYFALVLFNLAVLGVSPLNVGLSIAGVLLAFLGNPQKKMTFIIWDQPSFPLSVCVFIPFVIAATVNLYANYKLFKGLNLGFLVLLAPLLNAFGGAFEGIVAETRFNQWYHIIAVLGFNISMWLEWWFFEQSAK